jgi:hypothetical protein
MTEAEARELRAEVAEMRARLAAHERAAHGTRPRGRRRMPGRIPAALALALALALVPLGLAAVNPFTDLDPAQDAGHNPNIDLIYNAGITTGCSPTEYCPKEAVTREQMASFLARAAGLGSNPPVVNALTAVTAQNAVNATTAETAVNAPNAQPKYRRTVVVSPVGSPAQNGTELIAKLNTITDASAQNPYLLKIEPGVFDLGATALQMKEYVDVEGSGERVTTITSTVTEGATISTGTVRGVSNTELRHLAVKNNSQGNYATAIFHTGSAARITHVTAIASSSTNNNAAIVVRGPGAAVQIAGSTVTVDGADSLFAYAVSGVTGATVTIRNSVIVVTPATNASYGVLVSGADGFPSSATVDGSRVKGGTDALRATYGTIQAGASLIDGGGSASGLGSVVCVASYKPNYTPTNDTCN